ncbi:gamma-glutamyltransferase family protein [Roseococcus sp.]|uniref:gamma-glutamyltransferase family protein n=1 Tax=Roseococcus sp. TaxID=2109646 RepID=UPI003BA93DFE
MRALLLLILIMPGLAQAEPSRATRQMVATANPLASEAGRAMLRAGGSAIDAAVAAQAVLSVVEPHASGLLAGGVMLLWDPAERRLRHWEGVGAAPMAATAALDVDTDGSRLPREVVRTGRAFAVPGSIAVLAAAHAGHGRLPWADLFAPAIRLAQEGFPMPPYLHAILLQQRTVLAAREDFRAIFFDADGQPIPVQGLVRNPAHAEALRLVAARGVDALRDGPFAEAILAAARGGPLPSLITAEDLRDFRPIERDALCGQAFAHWICTTPAPSLGGLSVLQQLGLLERAGFARVEPGSAEAAHLLIEAGRLARADRRLWGGDPRFVTVPEAALISPRYLDRRVALIEPGRAMAGPVAGDPEAGPLTTHVAVLDAFGGAVSFTTTNSFNFGAQLLAMGVVLNNGLSNFARTGANRMQGGKRPATTMAPSFVFDASGAVEIVIGAGGGSWIPDAVAGGLAEMLAWRRDAWEGTARPRLGAQAGRVELEEGTPAAALAPALRAMGHEPHVIRINTGMQILRRIPGGIEGAADPRRDGVALGD